MSRGKFGELKNKLKIAEKPARISTKKISNEEIPKKKVEKELFQESLQECQPYLEEDDEYVERSIKSSKQPSYHEEKQETTHKELNCDDDTCSITSVMENSTPQNEEEYSEPVPRSFTKPSTSSSRSKTTSEEQSPVVRSSRKNEEDQLSKPSLLRLIKTAGLTTATGELVDTLKLLVSELGTYMIERISKDGTSITADNIRKQIILFFKDYHADVDQEMTLHPQGFEKLIRPYLEEHKCVIKRDVMYYFQLFIEACLVRILQSSDMISEANKRSRVSGRDLLVAFSIFTM
jgi:histone H3/H4